MNKFTEDEELYLLEVLDRACDYLEDEKLVYAKELWVICQAVYAHPTIGPKLSDRVKTKISQVTTKVKEAEKAQYLTH